MCSGRCLDYHLKYCLAQAPCAVNNKQKCMGPKASAKVINAKVRWCQEMMERHTEARPMLPEPYNGECEARIFADALPPL